AYSIINGTQVPMVTQPVLGGRFGNARAASAIAQAYSDIGLGEAALNGIVNTVRAVRQFAQASLLDTSDIGGDIRKRLSRKEDGAELVRMFDKLVELNAINPMAGVEVSEAVTEGRGVWGHTLAKTDRIARQLPHAIELINRSVTAVAAYRL